MLKTKEGNLLKNLPCYASKKRFPAKSTGKVAALNKVLLLEPTSTTVKIKINTATRMFGDISGINGEGV